MNNNFSRLADRFVDMYLDEAVEFEWTTEETNNKILEYVAEQHIDPAWEDELVEVIREAFTDAQ